MARINKIDLGPVSTYAVAKQYGYTGTEEEWLALIQGVAGNAEAAEASAAAAAQSAIGAGSAKAAAQAAQEAAETAAARDVTAWLDEHAETTQPIAVIDDTLSYEGAAAESKAAGDAIRAVDAKVDVIRGGTRNLNTAAMGHYRTQSNDGKIWSGDNKNWGMASFIPVTEGEKYTVSCGGLTSSATIKMTYLFDGEGETYVERAGYNNTAARTLTVPEGAALLHVYYRSDAEIIVADDAYLQIEQGTVATAYIPAVSAVDYVARDEISKLPEPFKMYPVLEMDDDLDTLDGLGAYRWNTSSVPANAPQIKGARLLNFPSDADNNLGAAQIVMTNANSMFCRFLTSSGWTAWGELATKAYVDSAIAGLTITENEDWEE